MENRPCRRGTAVLSCCRGLDGVVRVFSVRRGCGSGLLGQDAAMPRGAGGAEAKQQDIAGAGGVGRLQVAQGGGEEGFCAGRLGPILRIGGERLRLLVIQWMRGRGARSVLVGRGPGSGGWAEAMESVMSGRCRHWYRRAGDRRSSSHRRACAGNRESGGRSRSGCGMSRTACRSPWSR